MRYSRVTSKALPRILTLPWWIQSAVRQSVWMWNMLCEHSRSVPPAARKRSSHAMHFFLKDSSPTASTSSVMSSSGSSVVATANPRRTTMPEE